MPLLLLVVFIAVPLLELWVIGAVAEAISLGPTLLLLLVDSVLGAVLVRREGARTWRAFRDALAAGRVPGDELTEGALLLFGGSLLLTPGFITDVVGLALVAPFTRRPLARLVRTRTTARVVGPGITGVFVGGARTRRPGTDGQAEGVEVVAVERDEPPQIDAEDDQSA